MKNRILPTFTTNHSALNTRAQPRSMANTSTALSAQTELLIAGHLHENGIRE